MSTRSLVDGPGGSSASDIETKRIAMFSAAARRISAGALRVLGPALTSTAVLCGAELAAAQPAALDNEALRSAVAGTTVHLHTSIGISVPITYHENGTLDGQAGKLSWYLGAATDKGRWWVANGKLCQRWDVWLKRETQCMRIRNLGNKVYWDRDDGENGTATIVARAAGPVSRQVALATPRAGLGGPAPDVARQADPDKRVKAARDAQPPMTAALVPSAAATDTSKAAAPAAPSTAKAAAKPAPQRLASAAQASPKVSPSPSQALAQSAVPATNADTARYRVVQVRNGDVLNIRSGPRASAPAIGAIPPDAIGVRMLTSCAADWCFVSHGAQVGWVHRAFLAAE
jgi:hypothetical protein